MGNEASLEGGDVPEGLAPDGKGGFVRVSDGSSVDLTEDERRRLAAAMSRPAAAAAAARRPSESDAGQKVGASRGPAGLSKSRTVDAFNQGPPAKLTPGRSPSSLSLFESRFRQEPKGTETKSSGMFGSSFLSGANPLSAMSSMTSSISSMSDAVNIPKFGLFGDEEEGDSTGKAENKQGRKPPGNGPTQGPGTKGPQQTGPPKQGHVPPGQGQKPAQGPPGERLKQGQGPPGQGPKQGQGTPVQGPKQGQGTPGQGPKQGQGTPGHGPKQGQGTPGQGPKSGPLGEGAPVQGQKSGQGPPSKGPRQSQVPKLDQGGPDQALKQSQKPSSQGQQGPRPDQGGSNQQKGDPPHQEPEKPEPKLQGQEGPRPAKDPGPPGQQATGKPAGGLCPLCKTTQLNTGSKDPPNYNNCTECKNQVCSLCGFSPPDSAGKEWLCLNCQMQRAMEGMNPPGLSKPMQGSRPSSPNRQGSGKPGRLLIKQQSTSDQGLTPPTTPRQKSPGPLSPGPLSPGSPLTGSPKIDPKTGHAIQQKASPQQSPAKAKQESSFFGGFGSISLAGLTDTAKPPPAATQATESVTGKLFSGFGGLIESSKPPTQAAPKKEDSVAGKLFGGLGGLTESAKPPAAASQMFSFGSSLLSSATTLVSGEETKAPESPPGTPDSGPGSPPDSDPGSPPDSDPGSPPDSPFSAPGTPPDSDSAPDTPSPTVETKKHSTAAESAKALASVAKGNCPLCNLDLKIGSSDIPNYSLCMECKKNVCNQCGFNPNPHLGEKEWLCLNCQTQKALSGQLGDVPPPSIAFSKKQEPDPPSAPSSTPLLAIVDNNPVADTVDPHLREIKVANASTPVSSEHTHTPIESIPQETSDSDELKHSLTDDSVSDQQLLNSESLAEINSEVSTVNIKQLISDKIPEQGPFPDSGLHDTNQQTQSATVGETPAVKKRQSSCEKATDSLFQSETQISNVEPQGKYATISKIPVIEQQQDSSEENRAGSLSPMLENETQNPLTNVVVDNTAASVGLETRLDTELTQTRGAAPSECHENIESMPETSVQPATSRINEGATQAIPPVKPNSTVPFVNKAVTNEILTGKPQKIPAELTSSDRLLEFNKLDITEICVADTVASCIISDGTPQNVFAKELITSVNPALKVDTPANVNKGQESRATPANDAKLDISLVKEDKSSLAISEEVSQVTKTKNDLIEKEEEPDGHNLANTYPFKPPLEKESNFPEKLNEENFGDTKELPKRIDTEETVIYTLSDKDDEVVTVDMERNVGTIKGADVTPDEGKSIKDKEITKETIENKNDRHVLRQNYDKSCSTEIFSNDAETIVIESLLKENTAAVTERMPKEDIQLNKLIKQGTNSDIVTVKTVTLLKESEQKENYFAVAENVSQTRKEGLEDTTLKVNEQSDKVAAISDQPFIESRQEETVSVEVPVKIVQTMSTPGDIIEIKPSDKTFDDNDFKGEEEADLSPTGTQIESEKVVEPSVKDRVAKSDKKEDESESAVASLQEAISVSEARAVCDKDCNTVFDVEVSSTSDKHDVSEHMPALALPIPQPEPDIQSLVSEHDALSKEDCVEDKMETKPKAVKTHVDEDGVFEVNQEKTLKQPEIKEGETIETNLTSPSDLDKLESSVLPILKVPVRTEKEEKQTDALKTRRKLEVFPISPESPSSEEDKELSDNNSKSTAKKKLLVPMDIKADSLDDSSESFGKESPMSGDDEEFIRKQIIEMSENEDASPSDEENFVRRNIREDDRKQNEEKKAETVEKSTSGKTRRLKKKTTISPDFDDDHGITTMADKSDVIKEDEKEHKEGSQNSAALLKSQLFELNVTSSFICIPGADGEPEMESLTDSPDDRSKGEGSSSLHASSFTPGTSPTSLSSLDEDSDSSSPSQARAGEGKQHRKAKHRQTGQMLPTIEDSSEEEELREEEELLREQEKHKGSGKKSKKDKDEIRAQRRREHTKTTPSNLSPIEDASPTEEQRQEAEMEEIRRSSCSDFSPSIDSEPEGFEIHATKIAAVQKTFQLPISVSLHSPTDDQNIDTSQKKALKSADEAYEEIILRAKSPTIDKCEIQTKKESVFGGVLIEDYVYSSVLDNSFDQEEVEKISVPVEPKKLRSPDDVYEDMIKKRKEFMKLEQEYENIKPKTETPNPKIVLQPAENTFTKSETVTLGKVGKPLLDAEATYEELMKRVLTPGTSPTQPDLEVESTLLKKVLHPIPDLRVTQCSSGELSSDDETTGKKEQAVKEASETTLVLESEPVTEVSESYLMSPTEQPPEIEISASLIDLSSAFPKSPAPVIGNVSPLPTVPQYTPGMSSVVSTAPPVPPKPNILRKTVSQDIGEEPVLPPHPPPTPPKPTVFPRKAPIPLPPQASEPLKKIEPMVMTSPQGSPVRQAVTPTYKPHIPPPVPPKPTIPVVIDGHRPGHCVKPPIAQKPGSQPPSPAHVPLPARPTALPTCSNDSVLNLSPTTEGKTIQRSPKSPSSTRYAKNICDTYVVITLPSQPSSPVDKVTTQAPSGPGPAFSSKQGQQDAYYQPLPQPFHPLKHQKATPPPQTTRVPLAYTRVTESIEKQEICSPEKHVSSSCHIIEAISASAQPSVMPNLVSQVVTTEVQRTTVSVVHERTPPPVPAPRVTGVPMLMEKPMPQILAQTETTSLPSEVVDLRTVKVDSDSYMNGVDLSTSPDIRHHSFISDVGRHTSAVQSPVVNLSTESSTVSIVTDSITIVTCSATVQQYENVEISQASSVPLELTKNKGFEPVSQIIYRPVETQHSTVTTTEIPINLSVGSNASAAGFQAMPVTVALPSVVTCVANGLSTGKTTVTGAVDLSTSKPFNTVVSVDVTSADVVTTVITDDGKPVDLTAARRAVCCDVVYRLPFAGSCATQQPTTPLPEDRFGYRDDHYQFDRTPFGMRGFGGIKPSMSDTNLAEAGLFMYKSKNHYNFSVTTEGAVDLTSAKMSDAGEAVDFSKKGSNARMAIPPYSHSSVTSAVSSLFGTNSVLRSSNGVVYSSVAAPVPSTYAITTQPGSIFSTAYNDFSGMHTSDTMPSLSNLQNLPLTRSQSFLSTISTTGEKGDTPLNLEIPKGGITAANGISTAPLSLDSYTNASLEAIAASLEALSSPMVPGDGQYQAERDRLEMEKLKQQRLAEELEWERQEIHRFREQEQLLVQKELEELQAMKQHILAQQEDERQAHLMMQKETYAQQQQQLDQIQRLQEQLRLQLEEQKLRQMYPGADIPGHGVQEAIVLGPDGTVLSRKITDSGCQTDEEDEVLSKAYTAGRKKKNVKKSVDSCVQTDDEDQDEWDAERSRQSRPRTARGDRGGQSEISLQAHTEISIQTDTDGNIRMDTKIELSDSERTSPKKRPTPLEIAQPSNLKPEFSSLQAHPKSPKVLYSPVSPCISPSKSLEFVSYEKSLGDTSPQKLREGTDLSTLSPASPRGPKTIQRSLSDPKPMSPTGEERATTGTQYGEGHLGKGSGSTPTGTQKKVKRTLPNPPSEEESTTSGQTAYTTNSARRRMCRNSNLARAKILQDIDRELDLVERESSKLRKRQAELDEEEKEIDAKLRYLEMGINRRKDALLKERDKRERAYLQSVAEDRDYMSDSEVSNIRETRSIQEGGEDEDIEDHLLERPRTAPHSELDDFVPPQTKQEYGKYTQYQYPQSQYQSIYQTPQSYQSHSIYSSVPSLTTAQQQSYQQMVLLQQKAARQAALLSELDATKYDVINRQPDPISSAYLGVKYDKYGNHLDLRALEVGSIAGSPMSTVSDSYYTEMEHHTPRSYMLLEDAAELAKTSTGLSSSYSLAERELAKAEKLLRRSAADLGSTDYLGSTSRLHTFGKTPDEEDTMEEPYELKLLKQQLKQEFRRSTGTDGLEQLTDLSQNYFTPSSGVTSYSQRHYPKSEKYSISRLTLEKQAAKQLPASVLYQKHKTPVIDSKISKYTSIADSRGLETDNYYLGSTSASPRSSRLLHDEITFGLRKNVAEQQKYLGSTLGANLAGSLNLGQSLGLDSAYPSGSRSRPSSRPTSCYGLDLSIKRDLSSSSLRLKGDGESSGDCLSYQTPSGRTKPTSLPIVQSGRGRIPIVAQNSEEESPLSPVGQPMGMARASAGPLPPISADSRDQFGSCMSLQESQQQQHVREEPTRGRTYILLDDLQGTMSDSEAYDLRQDETDWFDKPRDGRPENQQEKRQGKGPYYPFPHLRVKLQKDLKDHSVTGNGLGIRVVGGKEVPGGNGDIGAYVAKVLPGGAAEQTGKILEGMQVLEWNGVPLAGKTYEEVQGLVGELCNEAEVCVRLDLNMLAESEDSHLELQEPSKGQKPPRSPGVDPKQLAAELQKVSQQQGPVSASSSSLAAPTSSTSSPGQPGSPSVSKKRQTSKTTDGSKTHSHPISGEIQLQIHYDKQLGNLIVHVLQARNLTPRDNNGYPDPFVKVYLLPGRGAENKRKSKHAGKSLNPEWNQTVIYKNIHLEQLRKKTLEVSVWDYDKGSSNDFLGEVLIDLSNTAQLDNSPRWHTLKEQSEGDHHRRSHSGQGRHGSSKPSSQHSSPKVTASTHDSQDSPKSSVTKSRSHGIFPDPAKDTQVPTIEKSHCSPGTSKPSSSEGQSQSPSHGHSQHSRSHGTSHSSKSAARQLHQDSRTGSSGSAVIARGEAQQQLQQQLPPQQLPPNQRSHLSLRHQRHSIVGVLSIQRAQSDWLPALPSTMSAKWSRADNRLLSLRKAVSEERPQSIGARSSYGSNDAPVTAASLDSGLSGSAYSLLEEDGETNEVDSAIFQVPHLGKIPNGTNVIKSSMGHSGGEGKTQVMGEIKIALKREMRTEGEHLVLEILQCRNITYKFKSPDHLPDLYVKLYVVNIATQKRIIKKKTRVCRHDREPSFNETFRFSMNPTGHSLQLFLVSNGGKFIKKTLIGEAYVWLDKIDLRKRVVSWHKLLASTAQIHS